MDRLSRLEKPVLDLVSVKKPILDTAHVTNCVFFCDVAVVVDDDD